MNIESLREKIAVDAHIDINHLDDESLKIPLLHGKYYGFYIDETLVLKGLEFELAKLMRFKHEYYQGKSPDSVYAERPFGLKVQRQDVEMYINSDEDIQRIKGKIELQRIKCQLLQDTIRAIGNRSFAIRDAIEFIKWKSGK